VFSADACKAVYIAHPDYLDELCKELDSVIAVEGNLVFSSQTKKDICFALDVWIEPQIHSFESISQAVKLLRAAGKFWYLNPLENIRRSRLIESELRKLPVLTFDFPLVEPLPDIGCFSLLDKNTLVFSSRRWKKSPLGHYPFTEDKKNPPSRAYLKLWEALSLWDKTPAPGDITLDLGAAPGGWTYVMQTLGTTVIAVDKAPLDPDIARLVNITELKQSAFALDPQTFSPSVDWLLCDVACYPQRTFELINLWMAAGKAKNFIFTIKLQGDKDLESLQPFMAIPNARVIHLFQNKHEVTFFYPAPPALTPAF
jgi:23S rRNA (cytidine2498-2'-O)-methyltransferase